MDTIYESLSDELSKKSLIAYISQLISGEYYHSNGIVSAPSYFDASFLEFHKNEVFVDCGAYDGVDTENFFTRTGNDSKAIIFEADEHNCHLVDDRLSNAYKNRFLLKNAAVSDKAGTICFSSSGKPSSEIDENGIPIPCVSIDEMMKSKGAIPTYVKMDIEGAEMMALKGASETILNHKPRLAICVYHRPEDLIEIWEYINSFKLNYKFYLRKHGLGHHETVLYAI